MGFFQNQQNRNPLQGVAYALQKVAENQVLIGLEIQDSLLFLCKIDKIRKMELSMK